MTDTRHPDPPVFRTVSRSPEEALAHSGPAALAVWMQAIQSITDAALAHLKLDKLLDELLLRIREALEVDAVRILLSTADQQTLRLRAAAGLEHPDESAIEISMGEGLAGWVAYHREAVIVDDISRVRVVNPLMRRFHSAMIAPLVVEGELIGVLKVGAVNRRRFREEELGLLQMVADRTALAIDRARLYESAVTAQQQAVQANQRYRSLFENNPTAVFALDVEGRFTTVNPATERISGYGSAELLGQTFLPLLAPEQRDAALKAFQGAVGGEARSLRTVILDREGRPVELQVSAFPIVVDDRVTGIFAIAEDITEPIRHLEAQQELLEQLYIERSHFEAVLQQLPAGVLIAEAPSGRLIMGNARVRQILRHDILPFAEGDAFGGWSGVRADGTAIQPNQWPLARAIAGERITGEEILLHRGDGTLCWIRVNAAPIRNAQGAIVAGVAVFHDVDRERRSADTMRFLAESSNVLHASLDFHTTVQQVARLAVPRIADWCAVDLLDAQGQPRYQAVAHHDPARGEFAKQAKRRFLFRYDLPGHPLAEAIRTGEAMLIHEIPDSLMHRLSGDEEQHEILRTLGMCSAMVVPMQSRGKTLGVLTFVVSEPGRHYGEEDLVLAQEVARRSTIAIENAQLYEDASAADQAKSDFLAVMSHELRTPLAAIMGYAELLQMGIPEVVPDAALRQVDRIEAAARHQLALIDEILTFSRLAANQEVLDWRRVDLALPVQEAAALVGPAAEKKGLAFRVVLPGDPVEITTDAGKLRQALSNLLFNAVQFTTAGEVELRVSADPENVLLEVHDTGIGIAAEHHERIFEPFWQVRQSSTREVGGAGLGLTVARRMIRLLGGELILESAVDRGATFSIRLPREPAAAVASAID
jgi:PAS domain S-box-containing protein